MSSKDKNKIKLDLTAFKKLLSEIDYYVTGIIEAARNGDDGYIVSMEKQQADIKNLTAEFLLQFVKSPEMELPITDRAYLSNEVSRALEKDKHTARENRIMWQNRLYADILRKIKADDNIGNVLNKNLSEYIEATYIIPDKKISTIAYSKSFERDSLKVVQDMVNDIRLYRCKNPQLNMF